MNIRAKDTVLSDGTPLEKLIDHERHSVSLRLHSDPEIYEMELARLWAKAWIVVGHESEIPNPGDYVLRSVGEDSVILVRQKNGEIRCLLNVCPHKGMQVCRTEAGNASVFRCIYHGWTYSQDGTFRGAPYRNELYGGIDMSEFGLRAARVGLVGGIIFVCWDEDGPSLDEYLGDMGYYLRMIFERTNRGIEVLGAPQRFIINANWKTMGEQFACDNYHSTTLHRSIAEMGLNPGDPNDPLTWGMYSIKISTEQGHGIICLDLRGIFKALESAGGKSLSTLDKLLKFPPAGLPPEMVKDLTKRFSENELRALVETPPSVGGLFPNIAIIAFLVPAADGSIGSTFGLHSFVPKGPDKVEYLHWNFVERDASEEFREQTLANCTFNVGASGYVEGDDNEIYPYIQQSARGYIGRQSRMNYLSFAGENRPADWIGPGTVHSGAGVFGKDDNQWRWWLRYFDFMTGRV